MLSSTYLDYLYIYLKNTEFVCSPNLSLSEVVTMAKKIVITLKGCNNGKIKLLQRLQVVTMAN